jgi:hypothetical protein
MHVTDAATMHRGSWNESGSNLFFFYLWSFGVSEPILTPVAVTAAAGSLDVRRLSGWWKRVVFPDVALGSHCSHHSCMRSQWTWFSCHLNKNTVIFFTREEYLSW